MPTTVQPSFTGGEISPSLYARVDLARYATGLRTCRNFVVQRHGGVANRPGTRFIGEVKDSTRLCRLLPFVFNADQSYVLEFGHLVMRVRRNGTLVTVTAGSAAAWSSTTPYAPDTYVAFSGTLYKALLAGTNRPPVAGGEPAWSGAVVYDVTARVTYNSTVYIPLVPHQNYLPSAALTAAWDVATTYAAGEHVTFGGSLYRSLSGSNLGNTPNTSPSDWEPYTPADYWAVYSAAAYWVSVPDGTVLEVTTPYADADLARLQVAQSADVLTIVHPSYATRELRRYAETVWAFVTIAPLTGPATPSGISVVRTDSSTPQKSHQYYVAAVDANGVESIAQFLPATYPNIMANLQTDKPITVSWSAVPGAVRYNIYRGRSGVLGYIGSSETTSFLDENIVPDYADGPRRVGDIPASLVAGGSLPLMRAATLAYFQQRLFYANTPAAPQTLFGSRIGSFGDFGRQPFGRDDDPVEYAIASRQVQEIRHLVPLQNLVVLTSAGEWVVRGTNDGVLTPSSVLIAPQGYRGCSWTSPVVVGNAVLFVQRDGEKLRDLFYRYETDGFDGADLTVMAAHLVDGFELTELAYQQGPNSVVWAVRSDGALLGLTYMREQEVTAWHRHDFVNGAVESICVVPEGEEDVLYLVVRRTINGVNRRYIERLQSRVATPVESAWFVDAGLAFDGRANLPHLTVTITGGTDWAAGESLTVTGSNTGFAPTDVGDQIVLRGAGDTVRCRLTITGYTSPSVVTATPDRTVPADLRGVAIGPLGYAMARDTISGLGHLEGQTVAVLADGNVQAQKVVTGGVITISPPAVRVIAGLPITSEIETLDLQIPNAGVMRDRVKTVSRVTVYVERSRGWSAGAVESPADADVVQVKERTTETYDQPIQPYTDAREVRPPSSWQYPGRVIVRQTNPLPLTVLAVMPDVTVGG